MNGQRSCVARLRPPHSHQHLLHRVLGKRQLLCIAGAQDHVGIGPVLRVEERIAADCNLGIGLGNVAELRADIAFARVGANAHAVEKPGARTGTKFAQLEDQIAGVGPRDMISILQTIKAAGALQAEIEVM